jgi:hypothetical protein
MSSKVIQSHPCHLCHLCHPFHPCPLISGDIGGHFDIWFDNIYNIFHCFHATLMFMWCLLVVSVIIFNQPMWPEDACLDTQWGEALWWHIQMHNGERTVTDITDVIQYHPKSSMSPMSPMSLMSPMTQMSPMSSNVRRHWVTFWHLVSLIYPIFHCLHATLMFMWCLLVVSVIMFKNQCDLKMHAWIFFGSWDAGHHFDLKYMGSKMRNVARIQLVRLGSIIVCFPILGRP